MDADGDNRAGILLLELGNDFMGVGAVVAFLAGEVLEEDDALGLDGVDGDVAFVFVDIVAGGEGHEGCRGDDES